MCGSGCGVWYYGGGVGGIVLSGIVVVYYGVVFSVVFSILVGWRWVIGYVVGDGSIGSGRCLRIVGIVFVRRLLYSWMVGLEWW